VKPLHSIFSYWSGRSSIFIHSFLWGGFEWMKIAPPNPYRLLLPPPSPLDPLPPLAHPNRCWRRSLLSNSTYYKLWKEFWDNWCYFIIFPSHFFTIKEFGDKSEFQKSASAAIKMGPSLGLQLVLHSVLHSSRIVEYSIHSVAVRRSSVK